MRFRSTFLSSLVLSAGVAACDDEPLPVLRPLTKAVTTADATLRPTQTRKAPADSRDPSDPTQRAAMAAEGLGDFTLAAGEAHVSVVTGGGAAPARGSNARVLTRFVHLADMQLMDDESPARITITDLASPAPTSSASRAQDAYGCRMTAGMTRSINAIHAETPLDFVLLGGDNTDNAQSNELDWVLTLLGSNGGYLHCDSGVDDDPVKGANNDPKDPFVTPGLDVPFRWVMGNHDVLNQGTFVIDDTARALALGSEASRGARIWSLGGVVTTGTTPADPERRFLSSTELLTRVAAHDDGHGISTTTATSGRATYTFDVPNTPIRFLVIDTTSPWGSAEGLIRQGDVTNTLKPLLDAAMADGKWVFLTSHHASSSLTDGGQTGGTAQPDAIDEAYFVNFVTSYPNVIGSFVGHSHRHRIRALAGNSRTVWEVMTASLMDFPHQSRVVEISDEDNGYLRIRLTGIDFAIEGDPVAAEALKFGIVDFVSGWAGDSTSNATDRNVDLYVPKP